MRIKRMLIPALVLCLILCGCGHNDKQKVALITDVGTVIGSHSGPGTLALFFLGSER